MTTVINTPPGNSEDSAGAGVIVGVLLAIVIGVLFFVYGLPMLRNNNANNPKDVNVNLIVPLPPNPTPAPSPTPSKY